MYEITSDENNKIHELHQKIAELIEDKGIDIRIKELYGNDTTLIIDPNIIKNIVPRDHYIHRYFHCSTFYYIEKLLEINPSKILDVGCGSNTFKKFYPIIYGIDPLIQDADEKIQFNETFIRNHLNEFECVMSICSLHRDISFFSLEQRICDFLKIVSPGGRAYIALNSFVLLSNISNEYFKYFYNNNLSIKIKNIRSIVNKIINQINQYENILEYNNLVGYGDNQSYSHIDGDIRILIEKT